MAKKIKINPVLLTIIAAWLLIPTGTPDDVITFWLMGQLGMEMYVLLLLVVGAFMVHYHITVKKAKKNMSSLIRRFK